MVEIVKQLGWTYVSTVAAQGEYGEKVRRKNTIFSLVTRKRLFKKGTHWTQLTSTCHYQGLYTLTDY